MNVHGQLIKGLRQAVKALAGEDVTINGTTVKAIINETERSVELRRGAMHTERTLVIQIESGQVEFDARGSNSVEARGETWKISSDPGSIRVGQAATTITLVEPVRNHGD